MKVLKWLAVAVAIWPILAVAQDDVAPRMRGQLGEALRDPAKVKIIECLGVKVYEDPQPPGHPPSKAECDQISQEIKRRTDDAQRQYETRMQSPRFNLSLAQIALTCGIRDARWYEPIQIAFEHYALEQRWRSELPTDEVVNDEKKKVDEVLREMRPRYTCDQVRQVSILNALDAIHASVTKRDRSPK